MRRLLLALLLLCLLPVQVLAAGTLVYQGGVVSGQGSGDVVGPAVSVDNGLVRYDGVTGKLIQSYTSNTPTCGDTGSCIFAASPTISNTAPSLLLTDTTASAKSLTIAIDANLAQLRESAGASGSLLVLDLANNRAGVGTASPVTKFQVGAGNTSADTAVGKFNTFDTDVAALEVSNWDGAAATYGPRIHFDNSGVGNWYIGGSNGANNFDIATTWGTPIIRIQSNGNVGIGTTGPGALLHVNNSAGGEIARFDSGSASNGYVRFNNGATNLGNLGFSGLFVGALANSFNIRAENSLHIGTSGDNIRMTILNTGNVGIGTTSPSSPLHVHADPAADGILLLRPKAAVVSNSNIFRYVDSTGAGTRFALLDDGTTVSFSARDTANVIVFGSAGNVGIGGTPGAKLHIVGGALLLDNGQDFQMKDSGGTARVIMRAGGANDLAISSLASNDAINFYQGPAFASLNMAIKQGNVGIGTATPASLLDLRAGDLTFSGANGQKYVQGRKTELTTIAAAATTATTITIPANAILKAVMMRVIVQPPGTATMVVTATTSGTVLQQGASMSTAINTTDVGTRAWGTNYVGVAGQTITITPNATPSDATGRVRFEVIYDEPTAPTS